MLIGGFVWRHIADALGVTDAMIAPTSVLLVVPGALLVTSYPALGRAAVEANGDARQ